MGVDDRHPAAMTGESPSPTRGEGRAATPLVPRKRSDHPCRVKANPSRGSHHGAMYAYEISVKGHLGPSVIADLAALEIDRQPAITILRRELDDGEQLHRVLDQISALGLELVEVRRVDGGG